MIWMKTSEELLMDLVLKLFCELLLQKELLVSAF